MVRILFTGGGTGGHVYPLVAVAEALKRLQPETELYFLGPVNFGREALANQGIRIYSLISGKARRYLDLRWPLELIKIKLGFLQALGLVFWIMPDVIFSKGGYGSLPVVVTGWLYRVPIIVHESDLTPGLANKWLGRLAQKIITSFPETTSHFASQQHNKIVTLGNPVRPELFSGQPIEAQTTLKLNGGRAVIGVLGGSQGAERLNDLLLLTLTELLKEYEVVHQTGPRNILHVTVAGEKLIATEARRWWHPHAFFDLKELRALYARADLLISRAGAGAIFEMAAAGKPSLLIPLGKGGRGEQLKNAYAYARTGAAIVLEEANLTPNLFTATIKQLLASGEKRREMSQAAQVFAKPEAANKIAEEILEFSH